MVLALTAFFTRSYWQPLLGLNPGPELGTGDIQATLTWESTNDLDLWVTDPAGETIFFQEPFAASGGRLDVDANAGCQELTTTPVENIFWPSGEAPSGEFRVEVQYYQQCESSAATSYHVRLLIDGEESEFEGTVLAEDDRHVIAVFER